MVLFGSRKQGWVGRPSNGGGPSLLSAMDFQNCYQDHNVGVIHEFKYDEMNRTLLKFPNTFDLDFWPRASRVVGVAAICFMFLRRFVWERITVTLCFSLFTSRMLGPLA